MIGEKKMEKKKQIKRILASTDFSSHSKYAIEYAQFMAKKCKATLFIIHVIDEYVPTFASELTPVPVAEIMKSHTRKARQRLKSLVEKEIDKSLVVEVIVARGTPYVEIIKTAKKKKVDLIVIAAHGGNVLSHTLFGSTAERVVWKAPCPVLSVKSPKHKFIMP